MRLTPARTADFSPAWSPDGQWIAAATGTGALHETDVVIFRSDTGAQRRILASNGGWPTFAANG